jgi:hypothetical protein
MHAKVPTHLQTRLAVTTKIAPAANIAVISEQELVDMLFAIKGAKMLSFIAATEPKMNKRHRGDKTPNPYLDHIVKIARVAGMVNFDYDGGVRRRLQREGKNPDDFEGGHSWHVPFKRDGRWTPFAAHKKTPDVPGYVRFCCQSRVEAEYKDKRTDTEVAEEDLKPFLAKPSTYENQGLDKPLIFLVYGVGTIESVTVDGTIYIVTRN